MITQTSSANQQPKIFKNSDVAAVFNAYPEALRAKLLALRQLIFDTAAETEGVGELEETLKWGQPSYLTTTSKSGSTIRIDRASAGQYAMYFNCQTTLVDSFKDMFPDEFNYEGNRSILFNVESEIPMEKLSYCISLALTYHLNKKSEKRLTRKSTGRGKQQSVTLQA